MLPDNSLANKSRVLVVDDEPAVCRSVTKVLERKGYKVAEALCASSALDLLEQGEPYDLIIVDLMMPQTSGVELLKIARERWPKTPVLIITGYASIASAVETTKLGALGYLPKPFTPEELAQAVEEVLSGPAPEVADTDSFPPESSLDVDMPFDRRELAQATSASYVEHLTRSDLPLVDQPRRAALPVDYCSLGERSCKRFAKQGMCKQAECPIIVSERKKAARSATVVYMMNDPIDVDMPFSRAEVASMTGEAYVNALGRSDMPVVGFWRSASEGAAAPKVLVVDDEPVVVNSIRKTLARKAYKVEEAFSGQEALSLIAKRTYDLVLLDMRLPDANGLELISDIRKRKPKLRVVIVTGYATIDTAVEAIKRGASDYVAKPFTPDELYDVTSRILKRAVA
ncbi:MAG: response regulator [Acidobacteriia bacterium]|nr:response regulator [Terriglobia bacterium]